MTHTPLILRIAFKRTTRYDCNLNATYEEPVPLFDSAGLDAVSSCRRVGAVRRYGPHRRDPCPARYADPARRGLPRRGGSVGGRGSALRAAALGGSGGRREPKRARRGEPGGELQLHAGPHRRAAAVPVRAVRAGRAGHREYRLRIPVQSACRSAARTVGAVRPLRLDAQLRPDRRAAARGSPAHYRQHGREPDRSADAVRTARIGLHRGDAFRRGARLAGRNQQTGNYSRERQRGMDVRRGGSSRRRRTGTRAELCPPPAVRPGSAVGGQHGTHHGDDRPGQCLRHYPRRLRAVEARLFLYHARQCADEHLPEKHRRENAVRPAAHGHGLHLLRGGRRLYVRRGEARGPVLDAHRPDALPHGRQARGSDPRQPEKRGADGRFRRSEQHDPERRPAAGSPYRAVPALDRPDRAAHHDRGDDRRRLERRAAGGGSRSRLGYGADADRRHALPGSRHDARGGSRQQSGK